MLQVNKTEMTGNKSESIQKEQNKCSLAAKLFCLRPLSHYHQHPASQWGKWGGGCNVNCYRLSGWRVPNSPTDLYNEDLVKSWQAVSHFLRFSTKRDGGRSWRLSHYQSCKQGAPLHPPDPLHSRMQVGARFNNRDIVSTPTTTTTLVDVTGARVVAAELVLFIPRQMGTKWLFMPPKDPIVTEMHSFTGAYFYISFYLKLEQLKESLKN